VKAKAATTLTKADASVSYEYLPFAADTYTSADFVDISLPAPLFVVAGRTV
jgi:hypothetical protein